MQEFGSLFQEHSLESVGASCKTVRNPSSYLRSAQGGSGAGAGGPGGTVPPRLRASSDRGLQAALPGSRRSLGVTSLPGDCGGPRACTAPTPSPRGSARAAPRPPAPRFPCAHQRGAGAGRRGAHRKLGGISPHHHHLCLLCAPRAARTAHGRARASTLLGERSKKRNSREGRKGGGNRRVAVARGGLQRGRPPPAPASGAGRPGAPGLTFWGSA